MYNYGGQTLTDPGAGRIPYPSARAHAAMYVKETAAYGGSGVMYMFGGFGLDPAAPTEAPRVLADLWQTMVVFATDQMTSGPVTSCAVWSYEAGAFLSSLQPPSGGLVPSHSPYNCHTIIIAMGTPRLRQGPRGRRRAWLDPAARAAEPAAAAYAGAARQQQPQGR